MRNVRIRFYHSIPKIKQVLRRNIEHFAHSKDHIERNADIAKLDRADVASVHIDQLGKLKLRQLLPLSVINDIETELFIVRFIFLLQTDHLYQKFKENQQVNKPCINIVTLFTQVILWCKISIGS